MSEPDVDGRAPDLFAATLRRPIDDQAGIFASDVWLRHALSRALKECPQSREVIAAEMGRLLGLPRMSLHMLNAYTAEGQQEKNISAMRLLAFIQATGALWLLAAIAARFGCIVTVGEDAAIAELGTIREAIVELQQREMELMRVKAVRVRRP